jgi:glycosyltransferase involved in cell wall biosynthesis
MKIAYVTTYESSDRYAWSGSGNQILRSLQKAGFGVETIGGLGVSRVWSSISRLKGRYYSRFRSQQYRRDREPGILRGYASQAERQLRDLDHDLVFSPGTIPIAYLRTDKPVVFWTDATFSGMVDFYPGFSNLCPETIRNGNRMEQAALSRCHLALYASDWAARTAIESYDVDPSKVKVVPFGANMGDGRRSADIEQILDQRDRHTCKLLFMGVDWWRKGGDIAVAVADKLNNRGVRTELHVVGCEPPLPVLPEFVVNHGFISKGTAEGRRHLERLFSEAHFFILPARAECYGLVFAEASSFGLPSVASNVGGIPSAVRDGRNGRTFPLGEEPDAYCDYIEAMLASESDYRQLARRSFEEYVRHLNWDVAGRQVYEYVRACCA